MPVGGGCGGVRGVVVGGRVVDARGTVCSTALAGGGLCDWRRCVGRPCLTAFAGGGALVARWRLRRATIVHAASGGSRSFGGGAEGTSGGQRVSVGPSRTSVINSLALVAFGDVWRLVGPRPVGPAIVVVFRVAGEMAKNGRPCAVANFWWFAGRRVRDGGRASPSRGVGVRPGAPLWLARPGMQGRGRTAVRALAKREAHNLLYCT